MTTHLVTGAGSGIGQAVADALHARGDDLLLVARSEGRADDLRERYAGADASSSPTSPTRPRSPGSTCPTELDSVVHAPAWSTWAGRRADHRSSGAPTST